MRRLRKDYTGKKVGNRTVLGLARYTDWDDPMWLVRCACGGEFESLTQDLKRKTCRLCPSEKRLRPYESLYNSLIHKAKERDLEVHLSYEEFVLFTSQKSCHYCGSDLKWIEYQNKKKGDVSLAYRLDRKDNGKPYTVANVVPCCTRCNMSRGDRFTYEEWKELGTIIRRWRYRDAQGKDQANSGS